MSAILGCFFFSLQSRDIPLPKHIRGQLGSLTLKFRAQVKVWGPRKNYMK
jgi:hypothetical protein